MSKPVLAALLVALLVLPVSVQAQTFEDDDADLQWQHEAGDRLRWTISSCEGRLFQDIEEAMARLQSELIRTRVDVDLVRVADVSDIPFLDDFSDPNAGDLLTSDIALYAKADIVVACIDLETYAWASGMLTHDKLPVIPGKPVLNITDEMNETARKNEWSRYNSTLAGYEAAWTKYNETVADAKLNAPLAYVRRSVTPVERGDEVNNEIRNAVILLPEEQRRPVPGCHDPIPIGNELREVSIIQSALTALGLGVKSGHETDYFAEDLESLNYSCSAWSKPAGTEVGEQTARRLQDLWGVRPKEPLGSRIANNIEENPVWWFVVPAFAIIAAAAIWYVAWNKEQIKARKQKPPSGIVSSDDKGRLQAKPPNPAPVEDWGNKDRDPYAPFEEQD